MADLNLAVRLSVKDADRFKAALRDASAEAAKFGRGFGRAGLGGVPTTGLGRGGGGRGRGRKEPELGEQIDKIGQRIHHTGLAMERTAVRGGRALASLVQPALDYERAIVDAVAVTGDAVSNMANEQRLRELTKQFTGMGYAAEDVAKAVGYMGMAGMRTDQIMGSMAPTLALAKAGSLEVARTTDLVTDVTTAFGLKMGTVEEANRSMTRTADVLTYTFTSANTTLSLASQSLFKIGNLAPQVGLSLESMAGAVGQLGSAGIKGAEAGTALRNMLLRLANPKGPARDMFKALKLDIKDLHAALARDDLPGMLNLLNEAMERKGWRGADRTRAIDTIFGNRTTTVASFLLNTAKAGEDGGPSLLEKQIAKTRRAAGITQTIADKKSGSDPAKVARMKAELEQMQIDLGTKVLPGLMPVAREIVDSLKDLAGYIEKYPDMISWGAKWLATIAATTAVGGPAVTMLGGMTRGIGGLVSMANLGRGAVTEMSLGASGLASASTGAAGAAAQATTKVGLLKSALGSTGLVSAVGLASVAIGTFIDNQLSLSDRLAGANSGRDDSANGGNWLSWLMGDDTANYNGSGDFLAKRRGVADFTDQEKADLALQERNIEKFRAAAEGKAEAGWLGKGMGAYESGDMGKKIAQRMLEEAQRRKAGIIEGAWRRTDIERTNLENLSPMFQARAEEIDKLNSEVMLEREQVEGMKGKVGGRSRRDKRKTAAMTELRRKQAILESKALGAQMFAERANIGLKQGESWREKTKKIEVEVKVTDKRATATVNPDAGYLSF